MKKFVIIIITFIILFPTTVCFAGHFAVDPDSFGATYDTDISKVKAIGETILGYIVNIAAVSSVVIIAFLGIKFMIGSVEQRAEYKKSFMPLLVGMFVVLSSSLIVGIFYNAISSDCSHFGPDEVCPRGKFCSACEKTRHVFADVDEDDQYIYYQCDFCGGAYKEEK